MWHSSPGKSPASTRQRQAASGPTHKAKTHTKAKQEEWEPLQGWKEDSWTDNIETIDIDTWSKKSNKRKPGISGDASKEGVGVYLCWTSDRCSNIQDLDEFVSASLSTNLKVVESAPSPNPGANAQQTGSKTPTVPSSPSVKSPLKKEDIQNAGSRGNSETKSSDNDSRTYDAESEGSDYSVGGRAISTAYTASECPRDMEYEDSGSSGCEAEKQAESATSAAARTVGVTRSAPVQRQQVHREQQSRKTASAKSMGDGASRPAPMRRVALRNSAAKSSMDMKQLTLDLPTPPPNVRASHHRANSPVEEKPDIRPKSDAEKAAVLRLMEERLKRSSGPNRLGYLLPNSGSMSVGDLLSSSPRIVHHLGPSGDIERDPNVYAALTGGVALTNQKEALSSRSPGETRAPVESAIGLSDVGPAGQRLGITPNGSRTKETSRSMLPSVSPSGAASVSSSAQPVDSTSSCDSVVVRQTSPIEGVDGQCDVGTNVLDNTRLVKNQQRILNLIHKTTALWDPCHYDGLKTLHCAISRCDRDVAELHRKDIPQTDQRPQGRSQHGEKRPTKIKSAPPRSERIERIASVVLGRRLAANSSRVPHRGPPGFRPAGKTPLQRAVETAHKKIHGQHYYLFTHSSSSQQPVDLRNLPRYSSSGQPVSGHQERASSGRSNQSERSINNAYVWKEHLENQIKQQRSTNAQHKKAQYHFQLGEHQSRSPTRASDFVSISDRNGHALINKPKAISCVAVSLKPSTSKELLH